jgi:hypothetical protein
MTDEFPAYKGAGKEFSSHRVVNHGKQKYVNGNIYTNTAVGFFSIFRRGIIGVYHYVDKEHLHRYLSEFAFRYDARKMTVAERSALASSGIEGKRLMYRDSSVN